MSINPTALKNFYENEVQRETVKVFMVEVLGEMAKEKAFSGESVVGIPEARELIDETFNKLDELYGKIEKKVINSPR